MRQPGAAGLPGAHICSGVRRTGRTILPARTFVRANLCFCGCIINCACACTIGYSRMVLRCRSPLARRPLDAPCCHRPDTIRMATRTADQVAVTWRPERPDGSRPHSRRHIARQRAQTLSAGLPSTGTVPPTSTLVPRGTRSGRHPRAKTRQPSRSAELICAAEGNHAVPQRQRPASAPARRPSAEGNSAVAQPPRRGPILYSLPLCRSSGASGRNSHNERSPGMRLNRQPQRTARPRRQAAKPRGHLPAASPLKCHTALWAVFDRCLLFHPAELVRRPADSPVSEPGRRQRQQRWNDRTRHTGSVTMRPVTWMTDACTCLWRGACGEGSKWRTLP